MAIGISGRGSGDKAADAIIDRRRRDIEKAKVAPRMSALI